MVDSRTVRDGRAVRRRRECLGCQSRFTTYEALETRPVMVVVPQVMVVCHEVISPSTPMAVGILARIFCGEDPRRSDVIQKGTALCLKALPVWDPESGVVDMYYWYYGTLAMHQIATGPFDITEPHTLTGQIALWLMLAHAIWATVAVRRGDEQVLRRFHRYSLFVWIVWLVPYFGGMYLGMTG